MTESRLLAGRYALGEPLGRGGMAEVRRGTDTRLGRSVAVKILRPDLARDPVAHDRFQREAQNAASLNDPTIVSVYDTGEDRTDGLVVPWIVMEHVVGRTLREVLIDEGPLEVGQALRVVGDVCTALSVAHAAGIVHRDIKPGNVMLTENGSVKVMDFGIARAAAVDSNSLAETAAVLGTAAYLSPEQARGEPVDARSDIYSTGCLLYELLTGHAPFSGENAVSVAYQHVRVEPVPPSRHDPGLPADLDAVVLTAMAKEPGQRYQSAAEMRADLQRVSGGLPVRAVLPDPLTLPVDPIHGSDHDRRTKAVVWSAVGLLLVALLAGIAGLIFALTQGEDEVTTVPVPDVVGRLLPDATLTLTTAGLIVRGTDARFDPAPVDQILLQTPGAGTSVERGTGVELIVSKGPEMTVVPVVKGLPETEAAAQIENARLVVEQPSLTRDANVSPGTVLDVIPGEGSSVVVGDGVRLVVASGQVEVPSVVGLTIGDATQALKTAGGFTPTIVYQISPGEPGRVLLQSLPATTKAARGSVVTLTVSRLAPLPTTPPPTTPPPTTPAPSRTPTASPSVTASPALSRVRPTL